MKQFLIFLLVACSCSGYLSQNECSKWYFGDTAALDLMTEPPTILYNSAMYSGEGSVSIADEYGALLFYSDGATVWNRQHSIMANGNGLAGNNTSSQAGLIVKKTGSNSIYFLFTPAAAAAASGLCYSEIDMSLAAGLGSVTVKNVLLFTPTCEKITGVRHCNGSDTWIVTHDYNTNAFRANLVTSSGVNTTGVISNVGPVYTNWYGTMKVSPSGKKIGIAHVIGANTSFFELYDFDKITGVVSNSLSLGTVTGVPYGCEFSPDGSKFYGAAVGSGVFNQWDLCAGSNSAIIASKSTVGGGIGFNSMQLAVNGKLYITQSGTQNLGVVNNPNNPAATCSFVSLGQSVAPNKCTQGLPNFISSSLKTPFTFTNSYTCNSVSFNSPYVPSTAVCASSSDPIIAISWLFGDPGSGPTNTSTLISPTHQYPASGTYKVKLAIQAGTCIADTVIQFVTIPSLPSLNTTGNYTVCPGVSATITATGANSYSWSNGSNLSSIAVNPTTSTIYTVIGSYSTTSCNTTKTVSVIRSTCAGLSELNLESGVKLYPNPFQNTLTLETKHTAKVSLYNQLGILVNEFNLKEGIHALDTSKYPNGVYMVRILTGNGNFYTKVVKA